MRMIEWRQGTIHVIWMSTCGTHASYFTSIVNYNLLQLLQLHFLVIDMVNDDVLWINSDEPKKELSFL